MLEQIRIYGLGNGGQYMIRTYLAPYDYAILGYAILNDPQAMKY